MKKDLILSSGLLIILLILIGVTIFLPVGVATITGSAKFDPNRINLDLNGPAVVKATIRFDNASVADINTSTILLESSLPPDTTYLIPGGLVAEFDGDIVVNILWAKINHMGVLPPNRKIWLIITGKLNDSATGTPFSVTGYIKIIIGHTPPPP